MIRGALAACAVLALTPGCSALSPADAGNAQEQDGSVNLVPDGPRMRVVLMSSLPLVHGEGVDMTAMLAGHTNPHPLHVALDAAHDLVVADAIENATLAAADLVILVQPRALLPEALVALDGFVRAGGRALIFDDPLLEWPAGKGMGDPLGPQRSSLLSPLRHHWGLALVDPAIDSVRLQPSGATLVHPGKFEVVPGKIGDAGCRIEPDGHVARCRPGRGRAIWVADADLLSPQRLRESGESGRANRRLVAGLIGELTHKDTS